ncbi:hypothetical protein [Gillisia hiemivivida]|uniref:Uncharacterized protein n=1 Tax=Gillisia hiemivivida TaxID=291190 RepID=A0A5C6ZV01_9FLAO|nr:hypothetical protein [Gillisia hiemivivida]TXD92675.1 hypothetical protein ES724_12920 [Gillisia hiemivivida]
MKIKFKKKRLYPNLLLGLLWTAIGVFNILEDNNLRWMDYGYFVIGILYLLHFIYDFKNQYLTIESGTIRKNALYGYRKKINLNEIYLIKKNTGDYILKTENQHLNINPNLIDENSFYTLTNLLGKLNLPSHKTPFSNIG